MEIGDIVRNIVTNHSDLVASAAIGLVVAVGVISFNKTNPSGEVTTVKDEDENPSKVETEDPSSQSAESVEEMTEVISKTLKRKPHLRKFFGLGDANAPAPSEEALNDAHDTSGDDNTSSGNVWIDTPDPEKEKIRDFVRKAQESDMNDEEIGAVLFRAGFGVLMVIGFIYSVNVLSKGEVGRFLVGMFPVEAEALGLKDYLQRL